MNNDPTDTIILERFDPRPSEGFRAGERDLLGVFIDAETTGFDAASDRIIQLAAVPFSFTAAGEITGMGQALVQCEDPDRPIPAEITRLTGITDAQVRGQRIDDAAYNELVANAAIVIAHNAQFDRPFVESRLPVFAHLRWGCSYRDVPWRDEYGCSKLLCLMWQHCFLYYDAHRADVDAYAGVSLLGTTIPRHDGKRALSHVLDAARVSHARIYATGAPFELKDVLKARGYQWGPGDDGRPKAWYRDVIVGEAFAEETRWLANNALVAEPVVARFTARQRFSPRIGQHQRARAAA